MICEGFLWCKLKNIGVFIHLIDLISSRKKHREQINVKDSKDHENNANSPSETRWGETHQKRERKERPGPHWLTMDPTVEMAFFTSSTLSAENLNTGEIEVCVGNWSFSRLSFLSCT